MRKSSFISIWTCIAAAPVVLAGSLLAVSSLKDWRGIIDNRDIAWHGEFYELPAGFSDPILSPDGTFALYQAGDEFHAIDVVSGDLLWSKTKEEFNFDGGLVISNGGERLVVGLDSRVYDGRTGDSLGALDLLASSQHQFFIPQVGISPDGSRLAVQLDAVPFSDPPIPAQYRVLDVETGEEIFTITNDESLGDIPWFHLRHATFNKAGDALLIHTQTFSRFYHVDLENETFSWHRNDQEGFYYQKAVVSPDLDLLAHEKIGVGVHIVELPEQTPLMDIPLEEEEVVHQLAFTDNGSGLLLATGTHEETSATYRVHDIATGDVVNEWIRERGRVVAVYTNGGVTGFLEAGLNTMDFVDASGAQVFDSLPFTTGDFIRLLPFDNDNSFLVLNSNGSYAVMDATTMLPGPWHPLPWGRSYNSVKVARQGTLAIMEADKKIFTLDLAEHSVGEPMLTLGISEYAMTDISRDGTRAAIGVRGRDTVDVFDLDSGDLIRTIDAGEPVYELAMTPDASHLAFFLIEDVTLHKVNDGDLVTRIDHEHQQVDQAGRIPFDHGEFRWPEIIMAISHDASHLAVSSPRHASRLIDMTNGTVDVLIPERDPQFITREHVDITNPSFLMEFSPDSHRLLISPNMSNRFFRMANDHVFESGTRMLDIRNRHHVREYFAGPAGSTPPPPPARASEIVDHLTHATFSLDGRKLYGMIPYARTVVSHDTGITMDDLAIVTENILGRPSSLPATAPGVDISEDGVLDSADIIDVMAR